MLHLFVLIDIPIQEPVPVFLGERRVWKGIGRKRQYVTKKDEAFYVPLMSTLQSLLNNKTVFQEVRHIYTHIHAYSIDVALSHRVFFGYVHPKIHIIILYIYVNYAGF